MELSSIYKNYYSDINPDIFEEIFLSDPTSNIMHTKCGHYVKWIANLYRNGQWKTGDQPETISALTLFEKHKAKLPESKRNINIYHSVSTLYDIVKQFEQVKTQRELKSVGRDDLEKVYEDDEWLIVVPHTVEAAKQYGKHTKWCTSAENRNMFEYYNEKGPLYIFVDKKNNRKYQAHFETEQFMDEMDEPVLLRKIGFNEDVNQWFISIGKGLWLMYDWIGIFCNGVAKVILNDKYNYISTQGKLISDTWFDEAWNFSEGFGSVMLKNKDKYKYNYINSQGKLLSDMWFDVNWEFSDGFGLVWLNNKCNYIGTNGKLLSDTWFKDAWGFCDGVTRVALNDKYNYINTQGKLLSDTWFDDAWGFSKGFARIKLNNKYNYINTHGKLLSDTWFDGAMSFNEGFAAVQLNVKGWNFISQEGKIISQQWFDFALDFYNGFAEVLLNGKWCCINTNGQLCDHNTKQTLKTDN